MLRCSKSEIRRYARLPIADATSLEPFPESVPPQCSRIRPPTMTKQELTRACVSMLEHLGLKDGHQ